jgi:hypothetical protein
MTWGSYPTLHRSAGLARGKSRGSVGRTISAQGRPVADLLLCLLRLCMISGNFLHAAQPVYMLAWPGASFLRRRGRSSRPLF